MDVVPIRRALISVSQKIGLTTFARGLQEAGVRIYSTGGTRKFLSEGGVESTEVADYTGFPEMLDGRVKTLHPKIYGGILARRDMPEHIAALEAHDIRPFDLVVVNLYPFEQTVSRRDCSFAEAIEQIDIGGPSMIRAAAKNHDSVAVVTDPSQYADILQEILEQEGTSATTRRNLSLMAFRLTAGYDRAIVDYLACHETEEDFPSQLVVELKKKATLRYGENPHQKAAIYIESSSTGSSLGSSLKIHGKELSYNNLLDLDSALLITLEFAEPTAVIIKHNNPCGAATRESLREAFLCAYEGDPVSAFGCVLGFNRPVDRATAEALTEPGRFVEAIIAPEFSDVAVELLTSRPTWKANVRLVEVGNLNDAPDATDSWDYRRITGGMLIQSRDSLDDPRDEWQVVSKRKPNDKEIEDLQFCWKIVKHVKSNAIVLAKDLSIVGVGAGQMNRVESVDIAIRKAGQRSLESVLASDAFFPFRDGPDRAANSRITAIIQPGGSRRDAESIAACNEHDIAMIFTGRRHFRH